MLIIHSDNISGISILYPSIYQPKSGLIKVVEIRQYRAALPYLYVFNFILSTSAIVNILNYSVLNGFVLLAITVFTVAMRIKLLPVVDLQSNQTKGTSIAPIFVILEHVIHFCGLALVGIGATLYGSQATKSIGAILLPVAGILILLPLANLLVDYIGKHRL